MIDDDQLVAGCLYQYLLANRWTVDVATDALAAAEMMGTRRYGVVVVDPYMTGAPHEDRGTLINTVRGLQPTTTLIVLTAYGSPELERTSAACGAAFLLAKPQPVLTLSALITAASQQRLPISSDDHFPSTR